MQFDDNNWYAAFVKTGEEDNVKTRLEYKLGDRLHFFFPKRRLRERKDGKWNEVVRPLFPGYLLVNGDIGTDEYYGFKNTPGLWKLLESSGELLPIPLNEINFFIRLINDGEVIGPSKLVKEGERVKVVEGPLMDMEGFITKVDQRKGRVKVRMTFLGEERLMDFAADMLTAY